MFAVFTSLFCCQDLHVNSWRNNSPFGAFFGRQDIAEWFVTVTCLLATSYSLYFTELGRLEIHKLNHFGHRSTHFVFKLELYHGHKTLRGAVHHSSLLYHHFTVATHQKSTIVSPA